MKVKINGYSFKIKFVEADDEKMKTDKNHELLGLTEYCDGVISIRKDMLKIVTRSTVIHELTHAFIFAFGYHLRGEEAICDFFGSQGDAIIHLADEIMKKGVKK